MNAEVIVRYRLSNVIDEISLKETGLTFQELVKDLVDSEGVIGIADEVRGEIVSIRQIPERGVRS